MNFQVPQFIEIENKIFGPLTFSQFIYIAGGVAIAFLLYIILPNLYIAILPMILIISFGVLLAFYKINNRSFISILQAMIKYQLSSKLYLWQKEKTNTDSQAVDIKNKPALPGLNSDRLAKLSWSLNIKEEIK